MGTYQTDANRETARIAAADLNTLYENWWGNLDGIERREARTFLGFGIPDACADKLAAAGLPQRMGIVCSAAGGVVHVRLPKQSLTAFLATHPAA